MPVIQLILSALSPFCGEVLRICNSFLLQFIPVAIRTAQSSYNHSVFQVAVSTCDVAEMSPKETAFAQDNKNLQVFGDKLALILCVPLLCFLNEKPVCSTRHNDQIPSTEQTFLRVGFPILNYLNMIDEHVCS